MTPASAWLIDQLSLKSYSHQLWLFCIKNCFWWPSCYEIWLNVMSPSLKPPDTIFWKDLPLLLSVFSSLQWSFDLVDLLRDLSRVLSSWIWERFHSCSPPPCRPQWNNLDFRSYHDGWTGSDGSSPISNFPFPNCSYWLHLDGKVLWLITWSCHGLSRNLRLCAWTPIYDWVYQSSLRRCELSSVWFLPLFCCRTGKHSWIAECASNLEIIW